MDAFLIEKGEQAHGPNDRPCALKERTGDLTPTGTRSVEALQDTFLRAYLAIKTFEGKSKVYSWLTRIAVNSDFMVLRKRRARPEILFDPQPDGRCETIAFVVKDSAPNPEELCVLHQRQLKTLRAIRRLSPHLRAPIRMQITHGWSIREISRALNISVRQPLSLACIEHVNSFPPAGGRPAIGRRQVLR